MKRMRMTIARNLKLSQETAASLTTFQDCDMSKLIALRGAHKDEFEKVHGVKLGFMSAFVAAASLALREIPSVNASIDDETQEIIFRDYCDVSVAVSSPAGLVTPVLRNTESMSFAQIEAEIARYAGLAKSNTHAVEARGGLFFSAPRGRLSLFRGRSSAPPPPLSLFLPFSPPPPTGLRAHVHHLERRRRQPDGHAHHQPAAVGDPRHARDQARAAGRRPGRRAADDVPRAHVRHRLIDGREAVTFLKSIANKIEDSHRMLLQI